MPGKWKSLELLPDGSLLAFPLPLVYWENEMVPGTERPINMHYWLSLLLLSFYFSLCAPIEPVMVNSVAVQPSYLCIWS